MGWYCYWSGGKGVKWCDDIEKVLSLGEHFYGEVGI